MEWAGGPLSQMEPQRPTLSDEFVLESIELVRERLRTGAITIFIFNLAFIPLYYLSLPEFVPIVFEATAIIIFVAICGYLLSMCNVSSPTTLNLITVFALVTVSLLTTIIIMATGGSRSPFSPFLLFYILGTGFMAPTSKVQVITFVSIFVIYLLAVITFDSNIHYVSFAANLASIVVASILALTGIHLWEKLWTREFRGRLMNLVEREDLSRSLHDDIGSDLAFVRYLSEDIRGTVTDTECLRRLAVISETTGACIENIKDFSFSMDKQEDTFTALAERMGDYGNKVLGGIGLEFDFTKRVEGKTRAISSLHVFNIHMFYKEAITNIVKHSEAGRVGVKMALAGGRFSLTIQDDGRGFDPVGSGRGGRGIENMKKRAANIGGEAKIDSSPGQGTRVLLEVSLK